MTTTRRTIAALALLACIAAIPAFGEGPARFRPASAVDPVVGRYVVTLANDGTDDNAKIEALIRAYGGRVEPYSEEGFHGFLIAMRPAAARSLSADRRVISVEEKRSDVLDARPPAAHATSPRTNWTATDRLWSSGAYSYDGAGNITKIGDDRYTYDGAGRLATATAGTEPLRQGQIIPDNVQNFDYDIYGNLKSIKTTTRNGTLISGFAVNSLTNQLTGPCPQTASLCFSASYDPTTGNQLGRISDTENRWDALGMMTELNGGRHERYIYDGSDERIATIEQSGGADARYRFTIRGEDKKVAREITYDVSADHWTAGKDYVYRNGALIASFSAGQSQPDRHYHVDHLGTTRVVTDGATYRLATHTYWPFGTEAAGSEADDERLKFTGHERDSSGSSSPGFDLDYMHARYYDPNAVRFLSIDPGKDRLARQPQSWNMYSYVRNSPLSRVDPDGRQTRSDSPKNDCRGATDGVCGRANANWATGGEPTFHAMIAQWSFAAVAAAKDPPGFACSALSTGLLTATMEMRDASSTGATAKQITLKAIDRGLNAGIVAGILGVPDDLKPFVSAAAPNLGRITSLASGTAGMLLPNATSGFFLKNEPGDPNAQPASPDVQPEERPQASRETAPSDQPEGEKKKN